MNYTVYKLTNGKIEKSVSCPEDMLSFQFNSTTHAAIKGSFDDSSYYVEAGVPVALPTKPADHYVFDYDTRQWIDPRSPAAEWFLIRSERDARLLSSDWTQLPDVPLATKEAWAAYRQALRDITDQPDPFNIVWPTQPQ